MPGRVPDRRVAMPIRVLPPQQAARIAAGEVVERPASVVKELVDNALDAGADSITVEIRGGGLEIIRVVDNGAGISADEAPLAFQRFATSKLPPDGSLDGITTLGFRGEALPSIAAVSGVTLVTRTAGEAAGTQVELESGEIVRVSPQGSPPGTSVAVRGLFRNVPARLKFLRSASAEAGRVQTLVQHFALAFPEVRFRLEVDGRAAFSASGRGSLRDACAAVFGARLAQSLLEADPPDETGPEAPSVHGLISPPDVSRSTRGQISLIVNRRWIQSRALTFALEEAYQGFLMERRHPLAVLHIAVPPQDVDVNVHPAKLEVRFRREREVFSTVQRAVRGALVAQSPVPTVRASLEPPKSFGRPPAAAAPPQETQVQQALTMFAPEGWSAQQSTPRQVVPSLRVLGQVQSLYIVAEGPGGMYLVDQHAAHERVLYEKVQSELQRAGDAGAGPAGARGDRAERLAGGVAGGRAGALVALRIRTGAIRAAYLPSAGASRIAARGRPGGGVPRHTGGRGRRNQRDRVGGGDGEVDLVPRGSEEGKGPAAGGDGEPAGPA